MMQNRESANRLIRLPTVLGMVGVGRSTWLAGVKSGQFPSPIKLSSRAVVWREQDIVNFIQNLSAGDAHDAR